MSEIQNDGRRRRRRPPAGWSASGLTDTFSHRALPALFRDPGPVPGVGFYVEPHHLNMGGVLHGGALLTLADMSLFDICLRQVGDFKGVTVTLNADFVGAGQAHEFVEATGEVTGLGKRMMFARGLLTADGRTLLSFSGAIKRID